VADHQIRYTGQSDDQYKLSRLGTAVPGGNMKKLGISIVLTVSAFCVLLWFSPMKANATSVTMQFTGVGTNNSGGADTYPYDFKVTPTGGGPSENLSLMCISFDKEIYLQTPNETWTANVVTAGSLGSTYEEEAFLYAQAVANVNSNTKSGAANWAAWALGESNTLIGQEWFLENHIGGTELTDAEGDLTALKSVDLADYADYLVYEPTSDGYSGRTNDGLPQTFVGGPSPTPEPSSLVLLGSGLLSAAGALYRRKRRTV
jgi:PEP-CTERM motif